jgi:hypothetical protein
LWTSTGQYSTHLSYDYSADNYSFVTQGCRACIPQKPALDSNQDLFINGGQGYETGGLGTPNSIQENLRRPNLKPDYRAALQKGLTHIPIASGVDIAVREIQIARLEALKSAISKHGDPAMANIQLDIDLRSQLQGEFAIELKNIRSHYQRQIAWLESNRVWLP